MIHVTGFQSKAGKVFASRRSDGGMVGRAGIMVNKANFSSAELAASLSFN